MIITKNYLETGIPQQSPLLRVSTRYTENLQKVQPVLGGGSITTFLNADHNLDLYTSGTDDLVFKLKPAKEKQAPYIAENLNIRASQLSLFQSLEDGEINHPAILGLDNNGILTLSRYKNGIGYQQENFEPKDEHRELSMFKSLVGATSNIYCVAIAGDDNSLINNFFSPATLKWASDKWAAIMDPDNKPAKLRELATVANDPVPTKIFGIGLEGTYKDKVLFSATNFSFSKMENLGAPVIAGKWGKVAHISVILDTANLVNVFAVESETGTIWVKKQKQYSASGKIEFDQWLAVTTSDTDQINLFGSKFKNVHASVRFDGLIELYCVAEDDRLYYTHQVADKVGKIMSWSLLFPLGNEFTSTSFIVSRNALGYPEVYSTTKTNELISYIQSPETTQWFASKIMVEGIRSEVISVPTHSIDLTILDANGVPQPEAAVSISTAYQTQISINGFYFLCSAVNTINVKADTTGKLSVLQKASGLAGATMYIETPFTGTGTALIIEPNYQLQNKIQKTTADDVLTAKDRSGNFLLQEKDRTRANAESIASIMQASTGLCDPSQVSPVNYFYHQRGGARFFRASGLNIAANAGKNWSIDFSSGFPMYSSLSAADIDAYRTTLPEGGFLGIDWSDIWNGIKGGFNKIVDGIKAITVSITDKITVFFELIIGGVKKVFEAIVNSVQQIFNIIEGVWNWLKVTAEKLYEWLSYFFNWQDIKRTAQVIEYSMNLFLDFTNVAIEQLQTGVADWIDNLKTNLKTTVEEYLSQYDNNTTLGTVGNEYKIPNPEAENAMDHNPLLSAYKENYSSTSVKQTFATAVENSPITTLIDKLLVLTDEFTNGDGKEAFEEAISYFSNIKENPDQALNLLFSGLVKVAESIALFALDLGKAVILFIFDIIIAIIDAFKQIMNEEWEIPVVSDLYKYITGEQLAFRPIQLLSYMIAIPSTLIYKLIKGETPFEDASAVKEFEDYFTLHRLKERAGIGPTTNQFLTDQKQESLARTLFKAGYAVSMFVASFADTTTAGFSSIDTVSDPVGYVSTGASILAAVFTNPWILDINPGKLICSKEASVEGSSGFKWGYIATTLGLLKSAAVYVAKKLNPALPPSTVVKVNEISSSIVGAVQCIIYVVEFVKTKDANPKVFARTLTGAIPGKVLRFLSLKELNIDAYYIPVGILGVLTFAGYHSAFIINFTIDDTK